MVDEEKNVEQKEAEAPVKKGMTTKEKVIFWVANAITLCVSVLLVVFVWLK